MLRAAKIIGFLATIDARRSRKFYESVLGLSLVSDDQFALAFDCDGTQLRIQKVESFQPHPFTAFGWQVADIRSVVAKLNQAGVVFEAYPFLEQNDLNIWQTPSGAQVAWFKDPDGNLLSLTQWN